jgi:hypothetical protein
MAEVRKLRAFVLSQQIAIDNIYGKLITKQPVIANAVYQTHNNGERPFSVRIQHTDGYKVIVLRNKWNEDEKKHVMDSIIAVFQPEDVFVGRSPHNRMTDFSGDYGSEFDGSSILLLMSLSNLRYIHIGNVIYSFTAYAPIAKFVSPVGNNDVVYAYAVDIHNQHYLLSDSNVAFLVPDTHIDPYDYYYEKHNITRDLSRTKKKKAWSRFENIEKWYVGKSRWTLAYCNDPGKSYDYTIVRDDSSSGDESDDVSDAESEAVSEEPNANGNADDASDEESDGESDVESDDLIAHPEPVVTPDVPIAFNTSDAPSDSPSDAMKESRIKRTKITMYIVRRDPVTSKLGHREEITRDEYIGIINRFGNFMGFRPMLDVEIVEKHDF